MKEWFDFYGAMVARTILFCTALFFLLLGMSYFSLIAITESQLIQL